MPYDRRRAFGSGIFNRPLLPFSDGFGSLSGRWTGAGFAVGSGVATITPTLSAEMLSNTGFDSDTTGWSVQNCTIASVAGGQSGNACELTVVSGASQGVHQQPSTTAGAWYQIRGYFKSGTSGNELAQLRLQENAGSFLTLANAQLETTALWTQLIAAGRATGATTRTRFHKLTATAGTMLFDTASMKAITLSTTLASILAKANVDVSVKVTWTQGTQAGIVIGLDSPTSPQNFIIVYLTSTGHIALDECVAGTYTNKIAASAITYGANKIVRIKKVGNLVDIYYDGAQVGTQQTMSANTNLRIGLFSTYSGNTFEDFAATNP